MKLAFVYSDIIFWVLCLVLAFFAVSPKKMHFKNALNKIGASRAAIVSAVLIFSFMTVCLMDSIHLYSPQKHKVQSLLDMALSPLDEFYEMSYSYPFASESYVQLPVQTEMGVFFKKAKLRYIDQNLIASGKKNQDILNKCFQGLLAGGFISMLLWMLLRKKINTETPYGFKWLALFVSVASVITLTCVLLILSRHYHILGTDKIGQDVFYQSVKSIRTGFMIGTLTTLVLMPFALILGMLSGFFSGFLDDVIQYIYTVLASIPNVLLIAASILILEKWTLSDPDFRLLSLCFILGITSWTSLCRLVRAETLKIKQQDYVKASVAMGERATKIIQKHVLPNLTHIVLITIALDFSTLVLAEAVLSYVGVGVDPTTYSWGNMINVARLELARDPIVWWSLGSAFIFMLALILPANILADEIQKAFDPKSRQD